MQTAQALMNVNTAKAKLAEQDEEDKKAKTFHEKEIDKMRDDPDNRLHKAAVALGHKRASEFLSYVTNPNHVQHDRAYKRFKDEFDLDSKKMTHHFVSEAEDELDAHEYEKKDPAYEATVLRKWKPESVTSSVEQKFYDNFCEMLKDKWSRSGYRHDKAVIENYAHKYGLKAVLNNVDLMNFEPKK